MTALIKKIIGQFYSSLKRTGTGAKSSLTSNFSTYLTKNFPNFLKIFLF